MTESTKPRRKTPEQLRSHRWYRLQRHAAVRPPFAHVADGLFARRLPRQADHRDHQHLERYQRLSCAFPATRRGGQARRAAGGRIPARDAGHRTGGGVPEADDDALSQPAGAGDRGVAALVSGRRRRADGRLRQDHARDAHGRDQHEPARDLHARGPDAERQLARQAAGQRLRRLEILGGKARRATSPTRSGWKSRMASHARRGIA